MNNFMQQLMWQSMAKDPRVKQILQDIKDSGMTAEEYFYKKANEQGVDPQSIISKLK